MGYTQFDCFSAQVNQWLNQIGEGTLVGHGDMGSNLAAARDFLEVHERLHDDLMERSDEVKALSRVAEDLAKAGDKVRAQSREFVRVVTKRISTGTICVHYFCHTL